MNIDIKTLVDIIDEGKSFVIASHASPDLDCISSTLALGLALKKLSKKVRYFNCGPFDKNDISQYSSYFSDNLRLDYDEILILVDCHSLSRICDINFISEKLSMKEKTKYPILAIDHHEQEENFDNFRYLILNNYPSTTMIIKLLLDNMNFTIDKNIASLLMKGFIYDTDYFRHIKDTSYFVLKDVSDLLNCGLSLNDLYAEMYYNSTVKSRQYIGKMIENMELFYEDKIIFIFSTYEDISTFGKENVDDNSLYELLFNIKSMLLIIHIKEKDYGVLGGSLRSKKGVDVQKVAKKFGGGGHINASGFKVKNQTIESLKEEIIQYCIDSINSKI